MSTIERIRARLATLTPERLEIEDDSAAHAGHASARRRGHYNLLIVSPRFSGLSRLARHRLVYAALGEMMHGDIHALAIQAFGPDEF